jgi:hypothetical protein
MIQNELIFRETPDSGTMKAEFRQIDVKTDFANLFLEKIRGSIRLLTGRIKLPKDFNKEMDNFIERPIP